MTYLSVGDFVIYHGSEDDVCVLVHVVVNDIRRTVKEKMKRRIRRTQVNKQMDIKSTLMPS